MRASTTLLAVAAILAGCVGSTSTPSPTSSAAPPTAAPAATRAAARLSVTASGTVECFPPFGCRPSFTILPGTWGPDPYWMASQDDPEFPLVIPTAGSDDPIRVGADATGLPTSIAPGRYRIAAAVGMVSDLASPPFEPPILGTSDGCFEDLVVAPSTTAVTIGVTFSDGPCRIEIKLR